MGMKFFVSTGFVIFVFSTVSIAGEVTYTKHIKPIFEAKCMGCHGPDSPELPEFDRNKEKYKEISRGPKMDSYSRVISFAGWPDTGALMRRLDDGKNTKDGNPGNMYKHLGDTDEERQANLELFKAWVGNWTLKRLKEISAEELRGIKIKYQ
jgi:hypothetical protein